MRSEGSAYAAEGGQMAPGYRSALRAAISCALLSAFCDASRDWNARRCRTSSHRRIVGMGPRGPRARAPLWGACLFYAPAPRLSPHFLHKDFLNCDDVFFASG